MSRGRTVFERAPSGSSAPDKVMTLSIDSLNAYNKAISKISPALRPILTQVVCWGHTPQEWAKSHGGNKDGGLSLLQVALEDLAIYYRFLSREGVPRPQKRS